MGGGRREGGGGGGGGRFDRAVDRGGAETERGRVHQKVDHLFEDKKKIDKVSGVENWGKGIHVNFLLERLNLVRGWK